MQVNFEIFILTSKFHAAPEVVWTVRSREAWLGVNLYPSVSDCGPTLLAWRAAFRKSERAWVTQSSWANVTSAIRNCNQNETDADARRCGSIVEDSLTKAILDDWNFNSWARASISPIARDVYLNSILYIVREVACMHFTLVDEASQGNWGWALQQKAWSCSRTSTPIECRNSQGGADALKAARQIYIAGRTHVRCWYWVYGSLIWPHCRREINGDWHARTRARGRWLPCQ